MTFPYVESLLLAPDSGDPILMSRPEVWVWHYGPDDDVCDLSVLVDTGADHCLLPEWVAVDLAIPTRPCLGPASSGVSGSGLNLRYGTLQLEVRQDAESYRWETTAFFRTGATRDDSAIVGHMGFLEFFTATFRGGDGMLDLEPNKHIPLIS